MTWASNSSPYESDTETEDPKAKIAGRYGQERSDFEDKNKILLTKLAKRLRSKDHCHDSVITDDDSAQGNDSDASHMLNEEARKQSQKAEKEKEEKEKAKEDVALLTKRTSELLSEKKEIDEERLKLRREKEAREQSEAVLKKVKWGPQKPPRWTATEVKTLQDSFLASHKDSEGNTISLKILVFGPTGNGKSSFCNGCRSAIQGTELPSTYHQVATSSGEAESLTTVFEPAFYGDHSIIDMPGTYESKKINSMNIQDIASGKVPFYAELTDNLEPKNRDDIQDAGANDVSCVVIVLKFDTKITPELKRQLEVIVDLGGSGAIAVHLVLTCLDICDPHFNDTVCIPTIYDSAAVQEAIQKKHKETGIAPFSISFVKNYTKETETDINTSLLHLRALNSIITSAVDQVEKRINKKKIQKLTKVS